MKYLTTVVIFLTFLENNHDRSCDLVKFTLGFKFSIFYSEVCSSIFLNVNGLPCVCIHTWEREGRKGRKSEIKQEKQKKRASLSGSVITVMVAFKNIFGCFEWFSIV